MESGKNRCEQGSYILRLGQGLGGSLDLPLGGAPAEGVFKREQVLHILAVDLLLPVPAEVRPQLLPQPGPLPALETVPSRKTKCPHCGVTIPEADEGVREGGYQASSQGFKFGARTSPGSRLRSRPWQRHW